MVFHSIRNMPRKMHNASIDFASSATGSQGVAGLRRCLKSYVNKKTMNKTIIIWALWVLMLDAKSWSRKYGHKRIDCCRSTNAYTESSD